MSVGAPFLYADKFIYQARGEAGVSNVRRVGPTISVYSGERFRAGTVPRDGLPRVSEVGAPRQQRLLPWAAVQVFNSAESHALVRVEKRLP